ncbi:protein Tob2 [Engraulis encrasicolus]|uniref:protein Tob2 n=1 Tax=Engraulis encrasicolus TaxID=184585 RepID=UPI002FD0E0DD
MHLEVKVAINFIVSYLYNKLPRRRADLFGEELEHILLTRYEGHWYSEDPLRGSAYRCLHLGFIKDPTVELAARRSGLDTEEVRANVPEELAVWIDPHEVSYRIGEGGSLKVLYFDNPLGLGGGESGEVASPVVEGDLLTTMVDDVKNMAFNPEAQVFVPISDQMSPVLLPSLSNSPTPMSTSSCQGMYGYSASSTPTNQPTAHSSNTSTPSPPSAALPYLQTQQHQHAPLPPPNARPPPQPITFTTASFAATKFGSTKMKKSSATGNTVMPSMGMPPVPAPPPAPLPQHQQVQPQQQMLSRTPASISPPGLLKHKALSLSLHSLGGGPVPSQLSPNAKEFVFPSAQGHLFFDVDVTAAAAAATSALQPAHSCPFQSAPPALAAHPHARPPFDPFSSPPPAQAVGLINANTGLSFVEKPTFVEGLSGYNLQYPSQAFQPVVLAN